MGVQAEEWHFVGLESSFPDISQDEKGCRVLPGCKTLGIPKPTQPDKPKTNRVSNLDEQVLVFKYKGSVHAVDNRCPHSAFPLKQGTIIDVEDFGPGIKCFRHGWSFDLTTGKADRGHHLKLNLWDIELRDPLISSDESVAVVGRVCSRLPLTGIWPET